MKDFWDGFLPAVEEMRKRQKQYFRTKGHSDLLAAKRSEEQVDAFIRLGRDGYARKEHPELIGDKQ
jgi:hypothetical protein